MKTLLVAVLILTVQSVRAQFADWDILAGGGNDDRIHAVTAAPGGGYLAAGYTASFGTGGDAWALRIGAGGDTLWSRTYGGDGNEGFYAACSTADGFLLAGYTTTGADGGLHPWFVRTDAAGDTLWTARHHDYGITVLNAVAALPDGFVGTGTVTRGTGYGTDGWAVKLTADGERAWSGTYGGAADDRLTAVAATGDGCVLAGITASYGRGGTDAWLVRLDAGGGTGWTRAYGGTAYDGARAVAADAGGVTFAGYREMDGAYDINGWLYRTNTDGDSVWARTYGGGQTEQAYALLALSDGGYALCGETASRGAGLYDAWLVRSGTDGRLVRETSFGGTDNDRAYALCAAPGGGYVLAGESRSGAAGGFDAYAVGVNAAVNPVTLCDVPETRHPRTPGFLRAHDLPGRAVRCLDGAPQHGTPRPGCYLVYGNGRGVPPAAVIVR